MKTVGSHFSEICGNKITAYTAIIWLTWQAYEDLNKN